LHVRPRALAVVLAGCALAAAAPPALAMNVGDGGNVGNGAWKQADHYLKSRPENVVWGGFPIDRGPVLTIKSGETVHIDTISHSGATSALPPEEYFGAFGVGAGEVLEDVKDFWASRPSRPQYGPHILTGPIYVEGAEPGDMLEVQILDLATRVPYGVNSTAPTGGVLSPAYPGWRVGDPPLSIPAPPAGTPGGLYPDVRQHLYRTKKINGIEVGELTEDVHAPLHPHMGVMGVAPRAGEFVGRTPTDPPPASGVQGSGPPGPFGGNLDVRDLTVGATLYLPVFQPGARYYTGDSHAGQGNGEVSGTAIEQSLRGLFRFVLHKGENLDLPWAEDRQNYIVMGIDHDLDRAMVIATREMVEFLVEDKGMTEAKAFSLASVAGDFQVAEVVDGTQVISGKIAKSIVD
jgi:acetamidase/formamidase